ncbi:MAG: HlyD family efflux transporter periplasmic adaptor subunit [Bryobacteraceae bacterium]|nr:HlyD family efflux transporter periplasmic adaptor subunit [Bryobacteraceae bacterium]
MATHVHPQPAPGQLGELGTLPAMRLVGTPHTTRTLARVLAALFLTIVMALVFTPWQQSVPGKGRVVALNPNDRLQSIGAPVEGRIVKWNVIEGSRVKAGQVLGEIADQDPNMLSRLDVVRGAEEQRWLAAQRRLEELSSQIFQLEESRENAIQAAKSRLQMAMDRVRSAEQTLEDGKARFTAADQNLPRQKQLLDKGLTSVRNLELAQAEFDQAKANVESRQAALNAAINDRRAFEADLQRITASETAIVRSARASLETAKADAQNFRAGYERARAAYARQSTQVITAPRDGTIYRLLAQPGSELLKSGERIAEFVPEFASSPVVELFLNGNDVPLVHKGDKVRLQFNGWPAIQFVGWPSVAVGTFGGVVFLVDPTDNGKGEFRILVSPDPEEEPWPSPSYLRQGVLANGWVLLKTVPLGFEMWRQFNGFPPVIGAEEPGAGGKGGGKGGKK